MSEWLRAAPSPVPKIEWIVHGGNTGTRSAEGTWHRSVTRCGPSMTREESDLCAQWTAANAAVDSVNIGYFGLLFGFVTLAAALFAAFYAKRSAQEAKRSADIAESSSEATLKAARVAAQVDLPVMVLTRISSDHNETAGGSGLAPKTPIQLKLIFTNHGRTPAVLENFYLSHYVGSHNAPAPYLPPDGTSLPIGNVVGPGETFSVYDGRTTIWHIENLGEVLDRRSTLFFFGFLDFSDFLGQVHRVGFKFYWSRSGGDGSSSSPGFAQDRDYTGHFVYRRVLDDKAA